MQPGFVDVGPPGAGWCQRWNRHRHSWRHASEGGFQPGRYQVVPIPEVEARGFVEEHHYAHSYPAALRRLGLTDREDGRLVGVAVLSAPASTKVLTNVLPTLEPFRESVELSRFVLLDEIPGNAESWMLSRVFRHLRRDGVKGVVSFSDPMPRTASCGTVVLRGHVGTIYQATNAIYTGRGTARTLVLLPDGTVLNDRAAQKVRSQEQGHTYVEQRLVRFGAAPMGWSEDPAEWLRAALEQIGARRIRHHGAHRYVFRLGTTRDQHRIPLGVPAHPNYPKAVDNLVVAA